MPEKLNPRQSEILEFLRQHARKHPYPPTVREIGTAVGLSSSSTVQNHLNALEAKGYIRRDPTKSRTVELVGEEPRPVASNIVQLPVIGRVAAGTPILADENIEEQISVGREIAPGDDCYALTVHGESMINAGINDGDIVVVRPDRTPPSNGTIVVARIENEVTGEGEVTVKRFYKEAGRVRLQAENPEFAPIYTSNLALEGRVVAVIRLLR